MKLIWILIFPFIFWQGSIKSSLDPPTGLMVEFIREPDKVRILDPRPEFSWIVPDMAGSQTAYQIMVSSSKEKLTVNEADLWNSNKTFSSQSTEIEYSGNLLRDNTTYYWKVRIWDRKDKPSHYSGIQKFKTGNLYGYATTGNNFMVTYIRPEKFVKTGANQYFADFGKDAFGSLLLEIAPTDTDTLIIHLGEKTDGQHKIDPNPGGTIRYQKVLLPVEPGKKKYTLALPPDSRNTGPAAIHLPDSIGVITPFRYCEIENCNFELKPENILQKAYWHYFDDKLSFFESSDTILNQVWDI
ncbi:MAG TPA: hypothetical protein VMW32_04850, partial [Bacteroidales bacterium]|nr:hypothetical protein [Bacteroidales bacterium]